MKGTMDALCRFSGHGRKESVENEHIQALKLSKLLTRLKTPAGSFEYEKVLLNMTLIYPGWQGNREMPDFKAE